MRPIRNARPGNLKDKSFTEEDMETNQSDALEGLSDINVHNADNSPATGDAEDPKAIPIVTQNAKDFDLNHFKQYSKRIECCNRDPVKIHNKKSNSKDHGTKDKGLIYVGFNAGMFEAIKKNMMKILKERFGVEIV